MIGHWWFYGRNWRSLLLQKRKLRPPNTEGPQEIWNLPRPWLQQTKKFSPRQKNYLWIGGSNNNERGPKVRNRRNYNRSLFFCFCLRFVFTIFYTGSFQVPPKKNHAHLQCQFLPKIPICQLRLSYMNVMKNGPAPPPTPSPITQGRGVRTMTYIFFCLFLPSQQNHLDSQIIPSPKKKFRLMSLTKYDSLFPSEEN